MEIKTTKFNKVMIIDDNNIDIFITKQILKKNAFAENIVTFNCPLEAFNYLESNDNEHFLPEILLLDLNLNGTTGFDFLDNFHSLPLKIKENISIYMVSSTVDPIDINKMKQNIYIKDFTEKHITEEFLNKVSKSFLLNPCVNAL